MTRRGIDHLVIAVRDLDAAAQFYERLGFQVGGRNRHPWGTENRLVQFPGSFLELITLDPAIEVEPHAPGRFNFGAFIRDALARREGLALLVLDSADARADAAAFAAAGIGAFEPLFFERRGRRPDGSETHVAFTLGFAADTLAPTAGFFVCQQHFPENFWSPALQQHGNGAVGVGAVALASDAPEGHRVFLETFTGATAEERESDDFSVGLARGRIDVMTRDAAAVLFGSVDAETGEPGFVAFTVDVPDTRKVRLTLDASGIPYQAIGTRLVVPASAAHGVVVAFEPTLGSAR